MTVGKSFIVYRIYEAGSVSDFRAVSETKGGERRGRNLGFPGDECGKLRRWWFFEEIRIISRFDVMPANILISSWNLQDDECFAIFDFEYYHRILELPNLKNENVTMAYSTDTAQFVGSRSLPPVSKEGAGMYFAIILSLIHI